MIEATLIESMGDDLNVVNAARVSFAKKSDYEWVPSGRFYGEEELLTTTIKESDQKLIKYLAEHGHYSPFGHCFASFHVKAPIFVARQLVKHEYLRWNEVSRRYVDSEPEFYDAPAWRGKAKDKKQGSEGEVDYHSDTIYRAYALQEYRARLSRGIAPEQARTCLPLEMMTEWWWSGSLDAFANMCNLRLKSDTQEETREVAKQISEQMSNLYPYSWSALVGHS